MILVKGLVGALFNIGFLGLCLFLPAELLAQGQGVMWQRAIDFLSAYALLITAATIFLALKAPQSLQARLEKPDITQPKADKILSVLGMILLIAWFVLIPFDVFAFQLFAKPSLVLSALGGLICLIGFGVVVLAIYHNEFAAPVIKDQSHRQQQIRQDGLYAFVRHPFYSGLLSFLAGLALWLESYLALLALLVIGGFFIIRIFVEEDFLLARFKDYALYKKKTRWRLIPLIW